MKVKKHVSNTLCHCSCTEDPQGKSYLIPHFKNSPQQDEIELFEEYRQQWGKEYFIKTYPKLNRSKSDE